MFFTLLFAEILEIAQTSGYIIKFKYIDLFALQT